MNSKYRSLVALLPRDDTSMQSCIDDVLPQKTLNQAVVHRLHNCSSLYYRSQFLKAQEVAEEILDYSWESLNTGHWKDVPDVSRVLYSFATLFKVSSLAGQMKPDDTTFENEICRLCDMGLLMGAPILDDVLNKLINIYAPSHQKRRASDSAKPTSPKRKSAKSSGDILHQERLRSDHAIPLLRAPSLEAFQSYMEKRHPLILEGVLDHWPASKSWSLDYLKRVAGHRTVPIELGSKYTDDEWGQRLMTVREFIDGFIDTGQSSSKGYLAQHQLFDQVPQLRNDIFIPDYCSLSSEPEEDVDINAWFGPAGTISPCHHDPKHNLLCQVVGRKYVRLYPSENSEALYPHGGASVLTNTSQVDVENPDLHRFPLFEEVDRLHCLEHVLLPGQVLYIPPKHWHYIRSLDVSFSVSFWWQ